MPIFYDTENNIFNIYTNNMSYIFGVLNDEFLIHIHYGKRIKHMRDVEHVLPMRPRPFSSYHGVDMHISTDVLPQEYPCFGSNDLRNPAFHAEYEDGSTITRLKYKGFRTFDGKAPLKGLPATYVEDKSEAQSLEIKLEDDVAGLSVYLLYTVFEKMNAITRSVRVRNNSDEKIKLERVLSCNIDFHDKDFDFINLSGGYGRERYVKRAPLFYGLQCIESKRGASSHSHNPFLAICRKNSDEDSGDVYGFSCIYSGNFTAGVEVDDYDTSRVFMGINPFNFSWILESGEEFVAPEVVTIYSDKGLGEMSRLYHKLYRTRLCRGKYRDANRPILINNWEATYFDFNQDKLLTIAQKAQHVGIEMLVLDDGWFGKRDNDRCSLGDWVVNKNKIPMGLNGLSEKINEMGIKFGLWFEPEMVSQDSNLFRTHPDWCIQVKKRESSKGRHQLVLDLSRNDVCNYIINSISNILNTASISYVKIDMNRSMTEVGSALLPVDRQKEVPHRYMLGLYKILEKLTSDFPDVLFEGCSGGGGRFDPGMLYYSPQIWTSDNSDAVERLYIQHGTSMVYPYSTMSAHVSPVPNNQMNRNTSLKMRGDVAMAGQFGYEIDLDSLNEQEIDEIKKQIEKFKQIRNVVHGGDMYRLKSPFEGNEVTWEFISEDKNTIIIFNYQIMHKLNAKFTRIRLKGLDSDAIYSDENTGENYAGDFLMNFGINKWISEDFYSDIIILKKLS